MQIKWKTNDYPLSISSLSNEQLFLRGISYYALWMMIIFIVFRTSIENIFIWTSHWYLIKLVAKVYALSFMTTASSKYKCECVRSVCSFNINFTRPIIL